MVFEPTPQSAPKPLRATLKGITRVINGVLFVAMVALGVVLGANIVLRFLFETPIAWSNAISRYLYIYIVFLGTAVSYMEGSHAQIDMVYGGASDLLKGIFDLLHCLIMLFLCAILIRYGIEHVIGMWGVHSPVLPFLSIGWVYLSVPISAAVIAVFLTANLFNIRFGRKTP